MAAREASAETAAEVFAHRSRFRGGKSSENVPLSVRL
jgi:hypothetical protein